MHQVVVIALPGTIPFELGIPPRILGSARSSTGKRLYNVVTCSLFGPVVSTTGGYNIVLNHGPEALDNADTVILVPSHNTEDSGFTNDGNGNWASPLPAEISDALDRIPKSARIVSICTAAFILAEAGLLDGKRVTTHWREADRLQSKYPSITVDANLLYSQDGNIVTSAGVASGIDACLEIVRADYGSHIANEVARSCVVSPLREGGQAQFIDHPVPDVGVTPIASARNWAHKNLAKAIGISDLAGKANCSVRSFHRNFYAETGQTPARWLLLQRLDLARRLLEQTDLAIDEIARSAGFGTSNNLRHHMRKVLTTSPSSYRRTFNVNS